jgi:hypothetical protein
MLFKNLRSRSKTSSKSTITKPSIFRITSADSHSQGDVDSKVQSSAVVSSTTTEEANDYEKFLAKARKDAEKLEKKRLKEFEEAERRKREVNMSPWARSGL